MPHPERIETVKLGPARSGCVRLLLRKIVGFQENVPSERMPQMLHFIPAASWPDMFDTNRSYRRFATSAFQIPRKVPLPTLFLPVTAT